MSTDGGAEKATEPQFKTGRDTIEYNEYPSFETNLISDAFIQKMVGQFNNEEPESSFDESWTIFGKSKPNPKDNIKYMLGKRHVEGFPTLEIMGFAEFEGVTAAVSHTNIHICDSDKFCVTPTQFRLSVHLGMLGDHGKPLYAHGMGRKHGRIPSDRHLHNSVNRKKW